MTNTFDTSRVGGGTYELEQDSSGNYKLKSVGFNQINKLNLPDLKTSDTTTTTPKTEDKKIEVADPFLKLGTQNTGGGEDGGQDYSGVMLKTPEVKDVSVRSAGDDIKSDMPQGSPGQLAKDKANQQRAEMTDSNIGFGEQKLNTERFKGSTAGTLADPLEKQDVKPDRTTGLQDVVTKGKSAVQSTIQRLCNLSPIRMAGNVLGAVVSSIAPEETNVQQLNKSYFNVNEGSQRIAGNPATDLYAGMNRTSDFGNLERAGAKRIATREKTAATKNVSDKFKADTEKMKEQQKDYQREKAAKQKATQGPAGSGGGGGSGSDSGRVICTDLHRTGELSTRDWVRDTKFTFKTLSKTHVKGYLLWAEPTVKHMQKYPRYRKIWKHIAQHRANDIAWRLNEGKFDLLGRIYAGIGEPVCWMLGNFVSDKQISKYNLTHWRRA